MRRKLLLLTVLCLIFSIGAAHARIRYPKGTTVQSVELKFPKQSIGYSGYTLRALTTYFKQFAHLRRVDMYDVRLHRKTMLALFDAFPEIDFGFTFVLEEKRLRSDMRYFSTLHSSSSARYDEHRYELLRVCKNLEILDLGHNKIRDIAFVAGLRNLRILILSDNRISDLSPLAGLRNLEYFEAFRCRITDISPLGGLSKLKDINIVLNRVSDARPLYDLPALERLWISYTKIKETDEIYANLPDTDINFTSSQPTNDGWREHPRYFEYTRILKEKNGQ